MQKQCQQLLEDVLHWGLFPTKVKTTHWRAAVPDPSMALSEGRGGLKPSSTEATSANCTIPAAGRLLSIICKKKPQSQSHWSPQKSSTTTLPSKAPAHLLHRQDAAAIITRGTKVTKDRKLPLHLREITSPELLLAMAQLSSNTHPIPKAAHTAPERPKVWPRVATQMPHISLLLDADPANNHITFLEPLLSVWLHPSLTQVRVFWNTVMWVAMELCDLLFWPENHHIVTSSTKKGAYRGGMKHFPKTLLPHRKRSEVLRAGTGGVSVF